MFPWWPLVSWVTDSRLARWLSALVAGLALWFTMRRSIRRGVELEIKADRLEGAVKADERMDHADIGTGASDDDNREWLRARGARRSKPRP